ncbi:MAG: hypothetical protein M3323_11595 [Actinomycetota bacterium]|nr:hypothetical protein [Actinomycetota bacterium]
MKRTLRAVAGTVLIVTGSFVAGPAAPAAAATSCLTVPVTTPGFTVGVGGSPQRIPSFSGISVCASTPDGSPVAPVVSNSVGGSCVTSCTTVSLQVSPLDLGPLSVTYVQDGVTNRQTVDPQAIGTSQGVCLVSIGTPQAPNPACTLSLGSDQDLVGTVAGLVSQVTTLANQTIAQVKPIVDDAVADAIVLVNQLGPQAKAIVDDAVVRTTALVADLRRTVDEAAASLVATGCNSVPDGPNGEDACTNPAGWASAKASQTAAQAKVILDDAVVRATALVADLRRTVDDAAASLVATGCNSVPDGPGGEDACTNPAGWAAAKATQTLVTVFQILADVGAEVDRQLAPVCGTFGPAPDGSELCADPIAWTTSNLGSLDHRELIREIRCWLFPDETCWW